MPVSERREYVAVAVSEPLPESTLEAEGEGVAAPLAQGCEDTEVEGVARGELDADLEALDVYVGRIKRKRLFL